MKKYKNLNGDSGVVAYDIAAGAITVQFSSGEKYLYSDKSAGADNVAAMQRLAKSGRGLSTFIAQHVHDSYARKWH